jgi:hypothetical protein
MATFELQVEGLTGLSIDSSGTYPTQGQLTQFLNDGVMDVTNKWLAKKPEDNLKFASVTGEQTSNASFDTGGADIISVVREDGVTSNNWRSCRRIEPSHQYLVTDPDSLHFASKFNPAFMIADDNTISVFPAPGADPNAFKVYFVNDTPTDETNNASLTYAHSDIKYFPKDKVYLVVLYATIKSLEVKISSYAIVDEDIELLQGLNALLPAYSSEYNSVLAPTPQGGPGRAGRGAQGRRMAG